MSMLKAVVHFTWTARKWYELFLSTTLKRACIGVNLCFRLAKFIYMQTNSIILTSLLTRHRFHTNRTNGNLIIALQLSFRTVMWYIRIMLATISFWNNFLLILISHCIHFWNLPEGLFTSITRYRKKVWKWWNFFMTCIFDNLSPYSPNLLQNSILQCFPSCGNSMFWLQKYHLTCWWYF